MSGNILLLRTFNFVVEIKKQFFNYQPYSHDQKYCRTAYCIPYNMYFFCPGITKGDNN
jgi:hypothetical protein